MRPGSAALAVVLCLLLASCGRGLWVQPEPPLVTPCLEEPSAHVPDEPEAPAAGAPITDGYVVALKAWANQLLGTITADRIAWRGERRCIQRLKDAGQLN